MNIVVVDDEALARRRLRRLLEELGGVEVVAEAASGQAALAACDMHAPDLVLMDIRMPGMDGLEAARNLSQRVQPPAIVFCTAYDDYAVAAFEASAVDYLVKPVTRERLASALSRARSLNRAQLAALQQGPQGAGHISARSRRGMELVPVEEVRCLVADQKYVTVIHPGGEILVDQSLRQLEQAHPGRFVRVHRNALVARAHLQGLERCGEGYRVRLAGIDSGPLVSRRHLAGVRALLARL